MVIAILLCGCVTTLTASSIAFAQTRGNSGLPAGSGNPLADLQTQITALQQQITVVQQQIAALPALAQDVATLKAQMTTLLALQTRVDGLVRQAKEQADALAGLGNELSQVKDQMKALVTMQGQLDQLTSQAAGQAQRLAELGADVTELKKQLADLAALKSQVSTLSSQVTALSSLQNQVRTLTSQVEKLASQPTGGATSLSVYDKNGQRIGDALGFDQDGVPYIGIKVGDRPIVLQVYPDHMEGLLLYFGGANCSGTTFVANPVLNAPNVFQFGAVLEPHGIVYAPVAGAILKAETLLSYQDTGVCVNTSMRTRALRVDPVLDLDSVYERGYVVR